MNTNMAEIPFKTQLTSDLVGVYLESTSTSVQFYRPRPFIVFVCEAKADLAVILAITTSTCNEMLPF